MSLLPDASFDMNEVVLSATLRYFEVIIALPTIAGGLCRNLLTAFNMLDLDYLEVDNFSWPKQPWGLAW